MSRVLVGVSIRIGTRWQAITRLRHTRRTRVRCLGSTNRAGNAHDGKASVAFLGALFEQLGATLECRPALEMRMDGALFHAGVIDVLNAEGVEYAIKVPFWR